MTPAESENRRQERVRDAEKELVDARHNLASLKHHIADWKEASGCQTPEDLRQRIAAVRAKLETIVCTKEPDMGVVLLSEDGPTVRDPETGFQVYKHEYFSPLGDALIEAWKLTEQSVTHAALERWRQFGGDDENRNAERKDAVGVRVRLVHGGRDTPLDSEPSQVGIRQDRDSL